MGFDPHRPFNNGVTMFKRDNFEIKYSKIIIACNMFFALFFI